MNLAVFIHFCTLNYSTCTSHKLFCVPLYRLNTCCPNSNPLIVYCAWPAVVSRKCQVLQSVLQCCLPCHSIYSIQDLQKGALSYVDFYCTVLYCTVHFTAVLYCVCTLTRGGEYRKIPAWGGGNSQGHSWRELPRTNAGILLYSLTWVNVQTLSNF